MIYADYISINESFQRSTNILHDNNCASYILSQTSASVLRRVFGSKTSNSFAITGPFGTGKSSFLVYLDKILSRDQEAFACMQKLQLFDDGIYNLYTGLFNSKRSGYVSLKIVGSHTSLVDALFKAIEKSNRLPKTEAFIKKHGKPGVNDVLQCVLAEIKELGNAGLLILIDELGKFIEYASDKYIESDIEALQDLAEYANKHSNIKLVVALHKSFRDYAQNSTFISFTEWDKIQGRFENAIMHESYYELMGIAREAIDIKQCKQISDVQQRIVGLYEDFKQIDSDRNFTVSADTLKAFAPMHPITTIAVFNIFSKYFQNQRSVFSFLMANEPYSYQSFIGQEHSSACLYDMAMLFDYINHLLGAYSINMVDKESWKLANEYIDSPRLLSEIQKNIIKTIAVVASFNLYGSVQLNKKTLDILIGSDTDKELAKLEKNGLIIHKLATKSYALINETSIDINEELEQILHNNQDIDYAFEINELLKNEKILARRFYIETGTAKFFSKYYCENNIKETAALGFKLVYVDADISHDKIVNVSKKNKLSIYIPLSLTRQLKVLLRNSSAIKLLASRKDIAENRIVQKILRSALNDNMNEIDRLLSIKDIAIHNGQQYQHTLLGLQKLTWHILSNVYSKIPIINSVAINNLNSESFIAPGLKKIFEHMLSRSESEYLGIDKFPPEKAIYLSVIKKSGMHTLNKKDKKWGLSKPKESNFEAAWDHIDKILAAKAPVSLSAMYDGLMESPFGLNIDAAKFFVFTYIIVNESQLHIFRENTYQFDFDIDTIMDMWKNSKLFTVKFVELTKHEQALFNSYLQIFSTHFDTTYSKENIKNIFLSLHTKFNALPAFCKNTKNISDNARNLRSAIISAKEPSEAFFSMFPIALGYKESTSINHNDFIEQFKSAFNEIVFSYKHIVMKLEAQIAASFHLGIKNYPYGNELDGILMKYTENNKDIVAQNILRLCSASNDLITFINSLCLILNGKRLDDSFDHDIDAFSKKLEIFSGQVLAKLDIVELINNKPVDVKKITISTLGGDIKYIAEVNNSRLGAINDIAESIKLKLDSNLSKDEKLYLISTILEKIQ